MYSNTQIFGYLSQDVTLQSFPNGTPIAKTAIADTDVYYDKQGQKHEETCFTDIYIIGKKAETFAKFMKKGSKVLVEGRLKLQQWQANDGSPRKKHALRVEKFVFADSKGTHSDTQSYNAQQSNEPNEEPPLEIIPNIDINNDEIPF